MSFLLEPEEGCDVSENVLMMVSSGPKYRDNRDRWRRDVAGREGMKLVFLVAKPPDDNMQNMLDDENAIRYCLAMCGAICTAVRLAM